MKRQDRSYEKDQYVQEWMKGLSDRTKENYLNEFQRWLDFIKLSPTEQIKKRVKDLTTQDLSERLYFENQFRGFKEFLDKTGKYKPLSVKTMLRTVASFFSRNGLPLALKKGDWESTQTQQVTTRIKLTKENIKSLYAHGNVRDRALLLVLAQSGFSEVDVSNMKIEHLKGLYENPETEHYFIEKPREKTGIVQATCLSYEAIHDIKAMLSERGNPKEGYLFVSQTKGKGEQLETRTINEAMKGLADKAGIQEFQTKALRSFYNSALLRADLKEECKDLMMGHERQSARKHYDYDEAMIVESYQKAFEYLTINGVQTRQDIVKLKEEFSATKSELAQLIAEQQKQIARVGAFLSVFMESTDLSEDNKEHYRKELKLLGVSEEITKKFNVKGVSKIHAKEPSKSKEGEEK